MLSLSLHPQTQSKVAKMSTDRYLWLFPLSTASDQIQKFVFFLHKLAPPVILFSSKCQLRSIEAFEELQQPFVIALEDQ